VFERKPFHTTSLSFRRSEATEKSHANSEISPFSRNDNRAKTGVFVQTLIKAKMLKQKRDLIDRRIVIASLTDSGRGTLKKTDEY